MNRSVTENVEGGFSVRRQRSQSLFKPSKPFCSRAPGWLNVAVGMAMLLQSSVRAAPPPLAEIAQGIVEAGASTWQNCSHPTAKLSSRTLFAYALALCEARQQPDRLERLFEVAAQMQDRDPNSPTFGNFRWYWSDTAVLDRNAVDFCMRGGSLLWLKHREWIPPGAREKLRELLAFAVKGCLNHRVADSYSNIAIMNAGNLILLGEALEQPEAAAEGYARLEALYACTWEVGIHEFDSPTYYGTDLDGLGMIEAFCRSEAGRTQSRALLEFWWTDIALNWFPAAQKLAGAHSRTYDYLRGLGSLDTQLQLSGWLPGPPRNDGDRIFSAQSRWQIPQAIRDLPSRLPRLVHQRWGRELTGFRTHCLLPEITLSSLAAAYGGQMDMPLTVDFAGPRESVRGYFIADGREDPYGQKKIAAGAHQKAKHLNPFWTAAQRRCDALGLAIYRAKDIPGEATTLASNFVLPMDADAFWVGEERVKFDAKTARRVEVMPGQALVVQKAGAAVAIRIPWARRLDGSAAPVALVFDGNNFGAVRLVVEHAPAGAKPVPGKTEAGAAFWVRIGNSFKSEAALTAWRRQFASASARVEAKAGRVDVQVAATDGPVKVCAAAPWNVPESLDPAPRRVLLELDGQEIGRKILSDDPHLIVSEAALNQATVTVPANTQGIYWEAESAVVLSQMRADTDPAAAEGKYVWAPGEPGKRGANAHGSVTWRLRLVRAGDYQLWGRVLMPTPTDDSFFVYAASEMGEVLRETAWQPGVHKSWEWVPLNVEKSKEPLRLALPAGDVRFEVRVREDGAKLDRLFLTANPGAKPE